MAGTGFAPHVVDSSSKRFEVPLVIATDENVKCFGRIVRDLSTETVILQDWPTPGKRKLCPGTGRQKQTHVETEYGSVRWENGELRGGTDRIYGLRDGDYILMRECNFHPDSGQILYPTTASPFIAVLAPPSEDVKLEDFRAFYFDGTAGFQVAPGTWHQPFVPTTVNSMTFESRQGDIKGFVLGDTVTEFNTWLKIPLKIM